MVRFAHAPVCIVPRRRPNGGCVSFSDGSGSQIARCGWIEMLLGDRWMHADGISITAHVLGIYNVAEEPQNAHEQQQNINTFT